MREGQALFGFDVDDDDGFNVDDGDDVDDTLPERYFGGESELLGEDDEEFLGSTYDGTLPERYFGQEAELLGNVEILGSVREGTLPERYFGGEAELLGAEDVYFEDEVVGSTYDGTLPERYFGQEAELLGNVEILGGRGVFPERYFGGMDEVLGTFVGAVPKDAPNAKKVALSSVKTKTPPKSQTVQQHGKTLSAARATAAKVVKQVAQAAAALKRGPGTRAAVKPAVRSGSRLARRTAVGLDDYMYDHWSDEDLLGAAVKTRSPKAEAAARRAVAAAAKSKGVAKILGARALQAKKSLVDLARKTVNQKKTAAVVRGKGVATKVRGLDVVGDVYVGEAATAALEEFYALVGASPDPNNPGFLDDGTPDPAAQPLSEGGASDTEIDALLTEGGGETPGASAMDDGKLPPPAPMDQYIPDMELVGGIPYNGEKGLPDGCIGSFGLMTRATDVPATAPRTAGIDNVYHYGFVWGKYHDEGKEGGIPFGENLTSGAWNHVHGRWILGAFRVDQYVHHSGGLDTVDGATALNSVQMNNPVGTSYGPLIGNPKLPDFVGMRVDAKGRKFWLPQEAPEWLTFPLKQAAALTAQAAKKASDDAAKADAARQAKEAADAQAEKARQDAEMALAEAQASSEAKVSTARQESEANQATLDAEKARLSQEAEDRAAALEERRAATSQAAAEAEQYRRAGDVLIKRAEQAPQGYEEGGEEQGYEGEEPGYQGDGSDWGPETGYEGGGPDPGAEGYLDGASDDGYEEYE